MGHRKLQGPALSCRRLWTKEHLTVQKEGMGGSGRALPLPPSGIQQEVEDLCLDKKRSGIERGVPSPPPFGTEKHKKNK